MQSEELNVLLRNLFKELVKDGYKKRHMCAVTLGAQSAPQFEGFVEGKDFGIKPLQRMVEAFGYDLHLVPIPKNDTEKETMIQTLCGNFVESSRMNLIMCLDNENLVKAATNSTRKAGGLLTEVADSLFEEITK